MNSSYDAIALLKADHRTVEAVFELAAAAEDGTGRQDVAERICTALTVHAEIEEEIFYPAFLEATGEDALHNEALVEHDAAKKLIGDIQGSDPDDTLYDARIKVLAVMVTHHVKEEEQADGLFDRAESSEMDLEDLGEQLRLRRDELMPDMNEP